MFILHEQIGAHRTLKTLGRLVLRGFPRVHAFFYASGNGW
jgi:hypothetical protein